MPVSKKRKRKTTERPRLTGQPRLRAPAVLPTSTEVSSWPVVRAYGPDRDAWAATGFGSAVVVRQQPDGRWAFAAFWISLLDGGLTMFFGNSNEIPQEWERAFFHDMEPKIPPLEEAPIELVSDYVWGAYVFGQGDGDWQGTGKMPGYYLAFVPQPPGGPSQWLRRLVGPHGLTPGGLLKVIHQNSNIPDIPDGQEVAVITEMTFRIADAPATVARLRTLEPEFNLTGQVEGETCFNWTRQYPPGHWSPLARLGERQVIGQVRVRTGRLTATAGTLSMASGLVRRLKQAVGVGLALERTTWTGSRELLAGP